MTQLLTPGSLHHTLQGKSRDIITLFHKANSPVSTRVAALLKQTSASVSEAASSDQSSKTRDEFDLNVTEDPPTTGQLETILDYAGNLAIPTIIKGAESKEEALKRFKLNSESFQRPVVCLTSNV